MAGPEQLSEEELRQYFAQLREAPAAELVAQAYTMIGTWAEAKLGRRDARTLIDALSGFVQGAEPGLGGDLATRMRDGISQLQMAQVQAEQQLAAQRPAGEAAGAEPRPASQSQAQQSQQRARPQPQAQPQQSQGAMTDRLWIPGRDPRPPSR